MLMQPETRFSRPAQEFENQNENLDSLLSNALKIVGWTWIVLESLQLKIEAPDFLVKMIAPFF